MAEVLHYRGDIRPHDPEHMIGPDFGGRYLTITEVEYDPDTDVSTAKLRGVMPEYFRDLIGLRVQQAREHARLAQLFRPTGR